MSGSAADPVVLVTVSVPDEATADRVGEALVDRRLAACVKRSGPVRSTYRWRGDVEREDEWVLQIMTVQSAFEELCAAVCELHPYEVPEVIATPVVAGSADYLTWVREQVVSRR